MIKLGVESSVICDTCGKSAIRRTLPVSYGGKGSRFVSYDTHSQGLTEKEHLAALARMDKFHEKLYDLQSECKSLPESDKKLSSGVILDFEFDTVHPDACTRRTLFIPTATIRAFGLVDEIKLESRQFGKKQTAKRILSEIKNAAIPILIKLKARFENGDF